MFGPKEITITVLIERKKITFKVFVETVNDSYECYKIEGRKGRVIILSNRLALRKNKALKKRAPNLYLIDDGNWVNARSYFEVIGLEVAKVLDTMPPDVEVKLPIWGQ